jgi:hypothetical protein
MKRNMNRIPWIAIWLTWGVCSLSVRAGENSGPRQWEPPTTAPTLHDPLPEKEYVEQLAAVKARVKSEQITDDTPWGGVLVESVDAHSPAKALGIKRGDILVASNYTQIIDYDDWIQHRQGDEDAVTFWSPSSGRRDVQAKPGLLGVDLGFFFRPEVRYLRELHPRDEPNPVLFAAAACAQDNPPLARSALAHLQKAGNTNGFIYFVDAIAASEEGDFDGAISSGRWAIHLGSETQKRILAPMVRAAALASFRLTLAQKIETDYPFTKVEEINEDTGKNLTVDLAKTIQKCNAIKWPAAKSCADEFASVNPQDETANMMNAGKAGAGGNQAAASIRRSRRAPFDAPDSQYNLYVLGPTASNVQFTARCRFSLNRKNPKGYTTPAVKFGISRKGNGHMLIAMLLYADGQIEISGTHVPGFSYRTTGIYSPGKPFDISLVVVGNRCEIDIAGVRAFCGPIIEREATRKLCIVFQAVGVKGQLIDVSWKTAAAPQ